MSAPGGPLTGLGDQAPGGPVDDRSRTVDADDAGRDARMDRRLLRLRRVGVAVLVLLYVTSVGLYARSISDAGIQQIPDPGDDGVALVLAPRTFSPQDNSLTALVSVSPGPALLDGERHLLRDLVIELNPVLGESNFTIDAGTTPSPLSVVLPADGDVQDYPFDRYQVLMVATVSTRDGDGALTPVPARAGVIGDLIGWNLSALEVDDVGSLWSDEGLALTGTQVARAGSTVAISLLILTLMIVLAVLGLLVARSVASKRRRIEATMASWFGAMLFALVPLRGFLPGAPPLGSWIDILIVFWVEVALMVALAVFISSWLRLTPRPDYAPRDGR